MQKSNHSISVLITHYNRVDDLLKCIDGIIALELDNCEIVVSDDGSSPEILKQVKKYPIDTLVESTKNQGLASNINKGVAACKGDYIIYCQEDFLLVREFKKVLPRLIASIEDGAVDMIRLTSYFRFNKVHGINELISLIPRFSFQNFFQNYYRYSDHPYIVKRVFYDQYGYYLDHTSGGYGETEYSVRLSRSSVKIGITNFFYAQGIAGSRSVMMNENGREDISKNYSKTLVKITRSLRLYIEWFFYNKIKRGLVTYKNERRDSYSK